LDDECAEFIPGKAQAVCGIRTSVLSRQGALVAHRFRHHRGLVIVQLESHLKNTSQRTVVIPARLRAETPHFGVQARLKRESRQRCLDSR